MAAPMDTADVDQRLAMSLDDLIKHQKKNAPKSTKGGAAAAAGNKGHKAPARQKRAPKGEPAAAGGKALAAGAQAPKTAAAKKRGARAGSAGMGLGVKVKSLKNAPVRCHRDACKLHLAG